MAGILPFIGPALQIGQGISSSVKGKQSANEANRLGQEQADLSRKMGEANLAAGDYLRSSADQYSNPQMGQSLMNRANNLGNFLSGIANTEAGNIGSGDSMNLARDLLAGAGNFDQYSFDQVQSTRQQAADFANQMGTNARQDARAQMAIANQQAGGALDAQLAQRGLSRDSGAAAVALSQLGQQNSMNTAQLESQLAQQAGQLGMQASQFDVQSALNLANMGSNYNLGMNQLRSQTGLGQAQGLMGLQQLQDQQAMQRYGMRSEAATTGLGAAQNAYVQNFLNPMMNAQNALGTLASYQGGYAQQGYGGLVSGAAGSAKEGYTGAGAGITGGLEQIISALANKQKGGGDIRALGGSGVGLTGSSSPSARLY